MLKYRNKNQKNIRRLKFTKYIPYIASIYSNYIYTYMYDGQIQGCSGTR
jgi:hypothetical protein